MPFTSEETERIIKLHNEIESRKAHENAAPNYKDSAALAEITEIVLNKHDDDNNTLEDTAAILHYLTDCYDSMCRQAVSIKLYKSLIETLVKLKKSDDFNDVLYSAARAANRYGNNDCEDLIAIASQLIDSDIARKTVAKAQDDCRSSIKIDPVEGTDEYLAVIDDVECDIEENKTMDFCHEFWSLKSHYLSKRGIHWRSPQQLNPHVMFD